MYIYIFFNFCIEKSTGQRTKQEGNKLGMPSSQIFSTLTTKTCKTEEEKKKRRRRSRGKKKALKLKQYCKKEKQRRLQG